jgi:hypothetical protein
VEFDRHDTGPGKIKDLFTVTAPGCCAGTIAGHLVPAAVLVSAEDPVLKVCTYVSSLPERLKYVKVAIR